MVKCFVFLFTLLLLSCSDEDKSEETAVKSIDYVTKSYPKEILWEQYQVKENWSDCATYPLPVTDTSVTLRDSAKNSEITGIEFTAYLKTGTIGAWDSIHVSYESNSPVWIEFNGINPQNEWYAHRSKKLFSAENGEKLVIRPDDFTLNFGDGTIWECKGFHFNIADETYLPIRLNHTYSFTLKKFEVFY